MSSGGRNLLRTLSNSRLMSWSLTSLWIRDKCGLLGVELEKFNKQVLLKDKGQVWTRITTTFKYLYLKLFTEAECQRKSKTTKEWFTNTVETYWRFYLLLLLNVLCLQLMISWTKKSVVQNKVCNINTDNNTSWDIKYLVNSNVINNCVCYQAF